MIKKCDLCLPKYAIAWFVCQGTKNGTSLHIFIVWLCLYQFDLKLSHGRKIFTRWPKKFSGMPKVPLQNYSENSVSCTYTERVDYVLIHHQWPFPARTKAIEHCFLLNRKYQCHSFEFWIPGDFYSEHFPSSTMVGDHVTSEICRMQRMVSETHSRLSHQRVAMRHRHGTKFLDKGALRALTSREVIQWIPFKFS